MKIPVLKEMGSGGSTSVINTGVGRNCR